MDHTALQLSRLELQELREAFELFDSDGQGIISTDELHSTLSQLVKDGSMSNDVPFLEKLRKLPKDARLSEDSFIELLTASTDSSGEEDQFRHIFNLFDTNRKGYINLKDLRSIADSLGESMTDEELEEMVVRASSDGQQKVTYEDFVSIMSKKLFS